MRTTIFDLGADGQVLTRVDDDPEFVAQPEFEGEPLVGVRVHELERRGDVDLQLVQIAAGGHYVMHSSPKLAFCHIVRGSGRLGLPDGTSLDYEGPETYVFHPDTRHDWHDVTADTLLAVAIVPDGA